MQEVRRTRHDPFPTASLAMPFGCRGGFAVAAV